MIKWSEGRGKMLKGKTFIVLLFFPRIHFALPLLPSLSLLQQFVFLLLFDIRFYCNSTFFYNSPLLPKRAAVCRYTIMEKSRLIHFSRSGICYCCCYTIYLMSFVVLNIKSLSLMTFFMVKVAIEMEAGMWAQVWRSFFLMHSKKLPLQCTQFSIFFFAPKIRGSDRDDINMKCMSIYE